MKRLPLTKIRFLGGKLGAALEQEVVAMRTAATNGASEVVELSEGHAASDGRGDDDDHHRNDSDAEMDGLADHFDDDSDEEQAAQAALEAAIAVLQVQLQHFCCGLLVKTCYVTCSNRWVLRAVPVVKPKRKSQQGKHKIYP
jgi:hypothetical protein